MVTLQMVHSVGEWPVARMILLASVCFLARTAGFAGTMMPCESCLPLPVFNEPCEQPNFGMSARLQFDSGDIDYMSPFNELPLLLSL